MKNSRNNVFKKHRIFFILLFLFIVTRFLILLTYPGYDREDNAFGMISNKILSGDFESIYDLRHSPYQMGYLLDGLIVPASFLLFGESYISLQLMNFFYSIPILFFIYFFLCRFFNQKIALIASSLFVFAPYLYQLGNVALSQYPRAFIFAIAIVYFFFLIFYENKKTVRNYVLLGLLSGLALFVNYILIIMLLTCILFWLIFDKKFFLKKEFLIFLLAFLVGFSPWIYGSVTNHFDSLDQFYLISKPAFEGGYQFQSSFSSRLGNIVAFSFPQAFSMPNTPLIHYIYYSIFVLSVFYVIFYGRKFFKYIFARKINKTNTKEIFFVIFILIFLLIFTLADIIVPFFGEKNFWNWRYYFFIYPSIFMVVSFALFRLLKNKRFKKISRFLFLLFFGFLVIFGIFSSIKAIDIDNIDYFIKKDPKALSYNRNSQDLIFKLSLDESVRICSDFEPGHEYLCYKNLILVLYNIHNYAELESLIKTRIENEHKKEASFIFGQLLGYNFNLTDSLSACKKENFLEQECYSGVIWSYVQNKDFVRDCKGFHENYIEICEYGLIENNIIKTDFSIEDCEDYRDEEYCRERFSWKKGFVQNNCNGLPQKYEKYCLFAIGASFADKYKERSILDCSEGNIDTISCEKGFSWYLGWRFGNNPLAGEEVCGSLAYPNNNVCLNALKKEFNILPFDGFMELEKDLG